MIASLGLAEEAQDCYLELFRRFQNGPSKIDDWDSLKCPDLENLPALDSLAPIQPEKVSSALDQLAVCKLNGGLGTSMGCLGPKSTLSVREEKSFLDLIIAQLESLNAKWKTNIPLWLMNSFYTHEATLEILGNLENEFPIHCFQQNRFPRWNPEAGALFDEEKAGREAWYPPGHGDIYHCLYHQGILDQLINDGKKILFVSNADNLGAEVNFDILNHMLTRDIPFLMEMTPKTLADVKGGTLVQRDGQLRLLEVAQVPEAHVSEFCGTGKFKVFNTNNVWINLERLKESLDRGPLNLNLIVNEKTLDGQPVVQLETAIGSAISHFPGAIGLVVERNRFLPVKNTSDWLLVQSDNFLLNQGSLVRNPQRKKAALPQVKLSDPFTNHREFEQRIPEVPGMLDLESLVLEGDVQFEGKVTLSGNVSLIGRKTPIRIPAGSVLVDQVIEQ